MEDSDLGFVMAESLMDQFHTVKAEVNMSQVCMFGDAEIASHYDKVSVSVYVAVPPHILDYIEYSMVILCIVIVKEMSIDIL